MDQNVGSGDSALCDGDMLHSPSGLVYQTERWSTYYMDARALWFGHYDELCQNPTAMPMSPDIEWYGQCDRAGILCIVTGRTELGVLAGYQISIVRPHPHYSTVLCGFEDAFYLAPPYRRGMEGVKLIKQSLKFLAERGVKKAYFMSSEKKPTDKIFKFLGFKKTHTLYGRDL